MSPYAILLDSDVTTVNWDAGYLSAGSPLTALTDLTVVGDDVYGYRNVDDLPSVMYHVGTTMTADAELDWVEVATATEQFTGSISSDDNSVLIWDADTAWRVAVSGSDTEIAFPGSPAHTVGPNLDQEDNQHAKFRQATTSSPDTNGIRDVLTYAGTNLVDRPDASLPGDLGETQYNIPGWAGYMLAYGPEAEADVSITHPATLAGTHIFTGYGKIISRVFDTDPDILATFWDKNSALSYDGPEWFWENTETIPDVASVQLWVRTPDGFSSRADDTTNLFFHPYDGAGSGDLYDIGYNATPISEDPNGFFYLRFFDDASGEIDTTAYADTMTFEISGEYRTTTTFQEQSAYTFHSARGVPIEDSFNALDCVSAPFVGGATPERAYSRVLPEGVWSVGTFLEAQNSDIHVDTHTFVAHWEDGVPIPTIDGEHVQSRRVMP